jgi:hypothetical protein
MLQLLCHDRGSQSIDLISMEHGRRPAKFMAETGLLGTLRELSADLARNPRVSENNLAGR